MAIADFFNNLAGGAQSLYGGAVAVNPYMQSVVQGAAQAQDAQIKVQADQFALQEARKQAAIHDQMLKEFQAGQESPVSIGGQPLNPQDTSTLAAYAGKNMQDGMRMIQFGTMSGDEKMIQQGNSLVRSATSINSGIQSQQQHEIANNKAADNTLASFLAPAVAAIQGKQGDAYDKLTQVQDLLKDRAQYDPSLVDALTRNKINLDDTSPANLQRMSAFVNGNPVGAHYVDMTQREKDTQANRAIAQSMREQTLQLAQERQQEQSRERQEKMDNKPFSATLVARNTSISRAKNDGDAIGNIIQDPDGYQLLKQVTDSPAFSDLITKIQEKSKYGYYKMSDADKSVFASRIDQSMPKNLTAAQAEMFSLLSNFAVDYAQATSVSRSATMLKQIQDLKPSEADTPQSFYNKYMNAMNAINETIYSIAKQSKSTNKNATQGFLDSVGMTGIDDMDEKTFRQQYLYDSGQHALDLLHGKSSETGKSSPADVLFFGPSK